MPGSLDRVRAASRAAEKAEARYRAALDERDEAIRAALADRYSLAQVAKAAGVSSNQVHNVSKGRRVSTPAPRRGKAL
jgi:hypothetical protein